jgi:glutamate:GABA antiporter
VMATDLTPDVGSGAMGQERKKMRKVLSRFDIVFFTIAAFISLDTIALTAAYGGGETFFWLIVTLLVWLLPYGMIVAELGSTFPVEGGPYAWPRMAFGRLAGSLTSVFYWMSNPVWMGGSLAAVTVATINTFYLPKDHPMGTAASIIVGIVVVWAIVGLSLIELKWGKWTGILGTIVRFLVLAIFLVLVVAFLVTKGKPEGTVTVASMKPTITGFLAVIGLLQFLFVGFELSSGAAEEMKNAQRDVPKMIIRSGVIAALVTGSMILGVLLVLSGDELSSVGGFPDAYLKVASILHGGANTALNYLIGVLVILTIISAGGVWLQGAVRVQAVAGLDGAGPLWLGKFSRRTGTPVIMNVVSAIIGSVFVALVFLLTSGSLADFFTVMVTLVISLTALMYFFMLPSVIPLRKKYPDHHRPFRIPGGTVGVWVCVILSEAIIVITAITLLWPGLLDGLLGQPLDIEEYWGVSRVFFETVTLGSLAFFIVVSIVFWLIGKRNLANGIVQSSDLLAIDPEIAAKTSGPTPPQAESGATPAPKEA